MEEGNELSIIKEILDGNIKNLDLNTEALNDIHHFLITYKKEIMKMIMSSEKGEKFTNKISISKIISSMLLQIGLLIPVSMLAYLNLTAYFPINDMLFIKMIIATVIPLTIITSRVLEKIYQRKMLKDYAKVVYNKFIQL